MRLQSHNFQWEDEPLEVLLKKYPNCKVALQWWCNAYYTAENGVQQMSRFSINRNKWLKEFITQNPPDFPISNKCCEYAKRSLQGSSSRKRARIWRLQVSENLKEESVQQITRPVFLKASPKAVLHTARYFGIRTVTSVITRIFTE